MSGGSYNYICYKDWDDVLRAEAQVDQMIIRLIQLEKQEYPNAGQIAHDTKRAFDDMRFALKEFKNQLHYLQPMWKVVEWRDSGDIGDDDLRDGLEQYEKEE